MSTHPSTSCKQPGHAARLSLPEHSVTSSIPHIVKSGVNNCNKVREIRSGFQKPSLALPDLPRNRKLQLDAIKMTTGPMLRRSNARKRVMKLDFCKEGRYIDILLIAVGLSVNLLAIATAILTECVDLTSCVNLACCINIHFHLRRHRRLRLAGITINPGLFANRMTEIVSISCKLTIQESANIPT